MNCCFRQADAAAWRRQRAAEAMAQTIEAAEEDLEKAKLLRRFEKLDESLDVSADSEFVIDS